MTNSSIVRSFRILTIFPFLSRNLSFGSSEFLFKATGKLSPHLLTGPPCRTAKIKLKSTPAFLKTSSPWISQQTFSKAVAAISLPLLLVTSTTNAFNPNDFTFTGDYADPLHPQCERHVVVSRDGKSFHYTGTDAGTKGDKILRGCSSLEQQQYGSRTGAFGGSVLGQKISAGDGVHEGYWEPSDTTALKYADRDGIRWDDGNKWVKLSKPEDVITFPSTYVWKDSKSPTKDVGAAAGSFVAYAWIGISFLAGAKEIVVRLKDSADKQ